MTMQAVLGTGSSPQARVEVTASVLEAAIEFPIGDRTNVVTTGEKGYAEVPFDCTLSAVRLFADASGSVVVDIWKDTYANFPPAVADTIIGGGGTKPTLSSARNSENTTLTGYTTSWSKGDILAFNVDSASTIKYVLVSLLLTKR